MNHTLVSLVDLAAMCSVAQVIHCSRLMEPVLEISLNSLALKRFEAWRSGIASLQD
jgi:hypothetical protein